ncbi:MAG: hypothetical protein QXK18_06125 [Candidatus Bathyarchaeia archaeon]
MKTLHVMLKFVWSQKIPAKTKIHHSAIKAQAHGDRLRIEAIKNPVDKGIH